MTTDQLTPDEHSSVVGGSTAARRVNCPRSFTLEQRVPPAPGSSYAREGTALHELMAIVLRDDREPEDLLPFTFTGDDNGTPWSYTVDRDLWADLGEPALRAFDAFAADIEADFGGTFDFVVEKRCAMPGIPDAFGTSDVIWTCGDASGVWDWKFGRNPVRAERNMQLMFYARAAMHTHPEMFGIDADGAGDPDRAVILSIMQPQQGDEPSEWETNPAELETFRLQLLAAVNEAKTKGDKARVAKGDWCSYAACKAICPLWAGRGVTFVEKLTAFVERVEAATDEAATGAKLAGQDDFKAALPELLDMAEAAESWAKVVFSTAHELAEAGHVPEGWKLKAKRSSGRAWVAAEDAVRKFFANRRYKLDDYMPRALLSVAQAEKLLARDNRALDEDLFEKKASTGTTLVRADNDAPEVKPAPERFRDLGAKLAALGGTNED